MKFLFFLPAFLLASALALCAQTPTATQMTSDLVGHTMGGRLRCWKFQSIDQIKQLSIEHKDYNARQCTCTIGLLLQATNAPAKYSAEARVHYTKTDAGWKLDQVGLLSLKKIR